jgi:hypothetical protein
MTKSYCKYHPQTPSRQYCSPCSIHFCAQCIKPNIDKNPCPICKEELESQGVGNTITPFWERIPRFFTYPARIEILIFLTVVSILSLGAIVSKMLFILLAFSVLKYGYVILKQTAEGNLSIPTVSANDLSKGNKLPFQQILVFLLMLFIVERAFSIGFGIGVIAFLFILLTLPASVMVIALEENIFKAINPLILSTIIVRIGGAYFVFYAFLLLFFVGSGIIEGLLAPFLPTPLLIIGAVFISSYFTLIMFNLMGYVIYQYHEALGFEGVSEFDESLETGKGSTKTDPFLGEINILLAEGMIDKYDLAIRILNKFAQRYPNNPDTFEKQHSKNPAIPKAYLLVAKILFEKKRQEAQAQKILTSLLRQFPEHPLIPEIKECLDLIKRMPGNPQKTA